MKVQCWNCEANYKAKVQQEEDDKYIVCPECNTRHTLMESGIKLVISSASTKDGQTISHPPKKDIKSE
jgi:DNA-directed RNA polymerase subunit RPC12/RpoP